MFITRNKYNSDIKIHGSFRQKTLHTHVADASFQETHFTFAGYEISSNVTENQIKFPYFLAKSDVSAEMASPPLPPVLREVCRNQNNLAVQRLVGKEGWPGWHSHYIT
jgi:hypothetical protein